MRIALSVVVLATLAVGIVMDAMGLAGMAAGSALLSIGAGQLADSRRRVALVPLVAPTAGGGTAGVLLRF